MAGSSGVGDAARYSVFAQGSIGIIVFVGKEYKLQFTGDFHGLQLPIILGTAVYVLVNYYRIPSRATVGIRSHHCRAITTQGSSILNSP